MSFNDFTVRSDSSNFVCFVALNETEAKAAEQAMTPKRAHDQNTAICNDYFFR